MGDLIQPENTTVVTAMIAKRRISQNHLLLRFFALIPRIPFSFPFRLFSDITIASSSEYSTYSTRQLDTT
jgi:hypothetical protein